MNNYLPLLQTTTLFAGLSAAELSTLLSRLGGSVRSYGKGEALVLAGEPSRRVGIVLSGELEAYRPAPGGARIPIAQVEPGGVFGDVLGGSSLSSPVTVLAAAPCEVLLLPYERLLLGGASSVRGFDTGAFEGDRTLVAAADPRRDGATRVVGRLR